MKKVNELIGKTVLRSKPVTYGSGAKDRSYMSGRGLIIHTVTDTHFKFAADSKHWLDRHLWDDGNWVEVESEKI